MHIGKPTRITKEFTNRFQTSNANREVYYYNNKEVVGYLTKADNLNLLVVRNAGHMVPLSQPPYAQQMLEEFTAGSM